jgi:hypothetical protein
VNPPPKPKRWWRRLRLSLFILTPLVLPLLIGLALYEYSRVVENLTNNIVTIATRYKVDLEIEKLHGNLLRGLRTGPVEIYLPQNGVRIEVDSLTATFSMWTIIGGISNFPTPGSSTVASVSIRQSGKWIALSCAIMISRPCPGWIFTPFSSIV